MSYRIVTPDGKTFAWAPSYKMACEAVSNAKYFDELDCTIEASDEEWNPAGE